MTTETAAPAIPPVTPGTYRDTRGLNPLMASRVRHEDFAAFVKHAENQPGNFTPVARPDRAEPTAEQQRQRVADVDLDLQREGVQRPNVAAVEPDQRLISALSDWLRDNGRTPENLRKYEAGMAQAYRGRRYGETPSEFEARAAAAANGGDTPADDVKAQHAALGIDVESADYEAATPEERAKAAELLAAVIPSQDVPKNLLHGYKLPAGLDVRVGEHAPMLAQARAANLPQSVVDQFIAAGV